jgi:hypothetical protein
MIKMKRSMQEYCIDSELAKGGAGGSFVVVVDDVVVEKDVV